MVQIFRWTLDDCVGTFGHIQHIDSTHCIMLWRLKANDALDFQYRSAVDKCRNVRTKCFIQRKSAFVKNYSRIHANPKRGPFFAIRASQDLAQKLLAEEGNPQLLRRYVVFD